MLRVWAINIQTLAAISTPESKLCCLKKSHIRSMLNANNSQISPRPRRPSIVRERPNSSIKAPLLTTTLVDFLRAMGLAKVEIDPPGKARLTNMTVVAQERGAWIHNNPKTKAWAKENGSRILVVNGNESSLIDQTQGPVTLFTAFMVSQLQQLQIQGRCLCFFLLCAHAWRWTAEDVTVYLLSKLYQDGFQGLPLPGAEGMPITRDKDVTKLSFIEKVAVLESWIYYHLRYRQVFILLDNISQYQDGARRPETQHLLNRLAMIAESTGDHYSLRLAVTSPETTYLGASSDPAHLLTTTIVNVPSIAQWNSGQRDG